MMGGRQSIYVLLMAALVCALSVFLVLRQINDTRIQLQKSGPGAFNYMWQTDRTLDTLAIAIKNHLSAKVVTEQKNTWTTARLRFDLTWSTLKVLDVREPGRNTQLASAEELKQLANQFLSRFDDIFSVEELPDQQLLVSALPDLDLLQRLVHQTGLELFHVSTDFHDDLSRELDKLYPYLWISGVLLLLTGTLLIIQLFRSIRRSTLLFEEARTSQEQLERVVGELRSGKLEQKAKDSFLAAASHDLRQPLHALGLFVNALENKVIKPEGTIILDKIKQSTEALSSLFNSLLDISRLDAGVVEIVKNHFDVGELFDLIQEEFEETAAVRSLVLSVSHNNEIAYTDPVLLGRILRNLVDNAIVHTEAGYIELSCRQDGKFLQIAVTDTGPGIPIHEQTSVFSEYYQLDNPERDRTKGLGLGLSIVKRLSELLGVSVTLDSSPGKGTAFILAVSSGRAARVAKPRASTEISRGAFNFQGALVIVIDDEQDVREGMELILQQVNCAVVVVESGEAAREAIVAEDLVPTLIIADYRLREEKTGISAVEMIREEINDDVPALIVTGDTSPERVREVARSGMKLLHKPVKPDELITMVDQLLTGGLRHFDQVS